MNVKNTAKGILAIAGVVASLVLGTHFAANAAEPETTSAVSTAVIEQAQAGIEQCHEGTVSAGLELTATAAAGTGEKFDQVNAACTQTGVTFSSIVDGLAQNFDNLFGGLFGGGSESGVSDPAILEHVAYGDLDAASKEYLATLTVEEQTTYVNGLDAMGGE